MPKRQVSFRVVSVWPAFPQVETLMRAAVNRIIYSGVPVTSSTVLTDRTAERGDHSSINEGKGMKKQARYHVNREPSGSAGTPAKPSDAVLGGFVTETFEYDGGRQVTVYVPADPPEAIVFAGDGQEISKWGRLLEKTDVPSTMIVGVHGLTDETLRLHEYSPGFEPERFAAHE